MARASSVTIGGIGGGVNVAATSGGDAEIWTSNDLAIGDVTHDFTVSASDSGSSAYVWSDNGSVSIGDVGGDFSVLVANGGDAEIFASGDLTIGNIGGTFWNQGTIDAGGMLTIGAVGGDFTNDGTIDAAGGIMLGGVAGNATSVSALDVALYGGSVNFGGGVESTFTIDFSLAVGDTLVLGDAPDFHGAITGFGPGDIVDFAGVSDVALVGYTDNGNNTCTLDFSSSSWTTGDALLTFDGDGSLYSTDNFFLSSDGNGGTQLTEAPVIVADNLQVSGSSASSTMSGLSILEPFAASDQLTLTGVAENGTLAFAQPGDLSGATGSGTNTLSATATLAEINAALTGGHGVTYAPISTSQASDHVALTIDDGHGGSDSLSFIFNVTDTPQNGDVNLTGDASGKDIIFASGYNDTLNGGGASDTFLFGGGQSVGTDLVNNFSTANDFLHFDASLFTAQTVNALLNSGEASASGQDTVFTPQTGGTITIAGVSLTELQQHQDHIILA